MIVTAREIAQAEIDANRQRETCQAMLPSRLPQKEPPPMPRHGRRSKAKPLMIDQLAPSLEEKCAYYLAKGLPPDADAFDRVRYEAWPITLSSASKNGTRYADRRAGGGSISGVCAAK